MDEITCLQADILKMLASPRRLEILHAIAGEPMEVGRIATVVGASQPNVSQHLAALRGAGLVEADRDGREVRYRIVDPDVMVACSIMRGVLERRLRRLGGLAMAPVTGEAAAHDDPSTSASTPTRTVAPAATL